MKTVSLSPYKADMHIHSCLSPCGDWGMSPKQIVEKSLERDLDIIAVCDHNTAENAGAVQQFGKKKGLIVFPGLEICSKEEIHILSIFGTLEKALKMQAHVYENLSGVNRSDFFGKQIIADENDMVVGENPRLLINATRLGIYEIVDRIHLLEGLSIASHILRPSYGIMRQLGFIPPDLELDGVEITNNDALAENQKEKEVCRGLPRVRFSDAHYLGDIGSVWTTFILAAPTVTEIRLALKQQSGRRIDA
jgi:3',5'-nucleoside bisphosphate phosphatase